MSRGKSCQKHNSQKFAIGLPHRIKGPLPANSRERVGVGQINGVSRVALHLQQLFGTLYLLRVGGTASGSG